MNGLNHHHIMVRGRSTVSMSVGSWIKGEELPLSSSKVLWKWVCTTPKHCISSGSIESGYIIHHTQYLESQTSEWIISYSKHYNCFFAIILSIIIFLQFFKRPSYLNFNFPPTYTISSTFVPLPSYFPSHFSVPFPPFLPTHPVPLHLFLRLSVSLFILFSCSLGAFLSFLFCKQTVEN